MCVCVGVCKGTEWKGNGELMIFRLCLVAKKVWEKKNEIQNFRVVS